MNCRRFILATANGHAVEVIATDVSSARVMTDTRCPLSTNAFAMVGMYRAGPPISGGNIPHTIKTFIFVFA
jgi:hypothetical protein